MLSPEQAVEQTREMLRVKQREQFRLAHIHAYLKGEQSTFFLPEGVPDEVRQLARMSRVNMTKLVVDAVTQSMYVDGFRAPREADDVPAWDLWQRNRMDKRQTGVHRAGLGYGVSYATVLPGRLNGDRVPKIRGVSPRKMTTLYGSDDDWPMWSLEQMRTDQGRLFRLFDEDHVYWVGDESNGDNPRLTFIETQTHGQGVNPVVRFMNTDDLDDGVTGEVEPLIPLQDQINLTTFGLLVSQHYGAFRQRYIIGWVADSEEEALKASAQKLWQFDDHPDEIRIGEFQQTELRGYIESREATLRHLATISQTPAHELLGQLVNLSAEALAAAEAAHRRKVTERQIMFGESWEQVLALGGRMMGLETDPSAWVRWRDTEARSMAQMADALGKMVQMLGVPPQELWERVPGVSQQEVERWKAAAAEGDSMAFLANMLDRQAGAEVA